MSTSMNHDEYQALVYAAWSLNGRFGTEDDNRGPTQNGFLTEPLSLNHSGQPDEFGGNVHTSDDLNTNLSIDPSLPEFSPWDGTDATADGVSPTTPLMTPDISPTTPDLSPTIPSTLLPLDLQVLRLFLDTFSLEGGDERGLDGDINQIQDTIINKDECTTNTSTPSINIESSQIQGLGIDSTVNAQVPQPNIGRQVNTCFRATVPRTFKRHVSTVHEKPLGTIRLPQPDFSDYPEWLQSRLSALNDTAARVWEQQTRSNGI
ncbi:hypothetical protein K435DRAFT_796812 [Dendrothele bispora CBS 962.96]|uniref:Uncharacterized protein n=1 Tax=Dendrothele bispora (strain CBS 962.96) TaxID=1314807 RepID=A0A4S8M4K0_DENBC|nr:hypothetical protein K435DRAFT_796812 [Dendrothele bispora CBS 962.96]